MAEVKKVTLKRFNGTDNDDLHPTTSWDQIESKPTTFTPTSHNLNSHSDVNATPSDGQVLTWDGTNSVWIAGDGGAGTSVTKTDLQNLYIYGKASAAITKGQAVQFDGAQGDHILLKPAVPSEINSNPDYMIGIAETDLSTGAFGYILVNGRLNLDTSTYSAGDILYFASAGSTAGALTTTEPTGGTAIIQMAAVSISGVGTGEFVVRTILLSREIHEVIDLQDSLDAKVDLAGDTMTGTLTISAAKTTDDPLLKLVSTATGDGDAVIELEANDTGEAGLIFKNPDNTNAAGWFLGYGDAFSENFYLRDLQNTANRLTVGHGGNVGIGTDSPAANLSIHDSADALTYLQLTNNATGTSLTDGLNILQNGLNSVFINRENGYMSFETNNTEKVRITSGGNVGIGTINPSTRLEVYGTNGSQNLITLNNSFGGNTVYGINNYIRGVSNAGFSLRDETAGVERFVISSTGNVGIGITNPTFKLAINGGSQTRGIAYFTQSSPTNSLALDATTPTLHKIYTNDAAANLSLGTGSSTNQLYLKNDGKIGIGTTSPAEKLQVEGNAVINGDLTLNGDFNITGTYTQIDTDVNTTEQWLVTNDGTGPAAIINQKGAQPVIDIQDDGVSAFYIADGGNVGIGTTSPGATLHLSDAANSAVTTFNANGRITMSGDGVINWGSAAQFGQLTWDTNKAIVRAQSSSALHLGANANSNHMVINTSGNVGIGTTSPSEKLQVTENNGRSDISIHRDGSNLSTNTDIGRISFDADYNSSLINYAYIRARSNDISNVRGSLDFDVKSTSGELLTGLSLYGTSSGVNVGIGTTSPASKLNVVGGSLTVGDTGQFYGHSTFPDVGPSAEIGYWPTGGYAFVQAFDRGESARVPLQLIGTTVAIKTGTSNDPRLTIDASGVTRFGQQAAYGVMIAGGLIMKDYADSSLTNGRMYFQNDQFYFRAGGEGENDATAGTELNVRRSDGSFSKVFHDTYHPNADKWTTARTITLGGDLTGSVSLDGSANVTLSAEVVNGSHTHDDRYYTESEADGRFVNVTGDTMTATLTVNNPTAAYNSFVATNGTQNISMGVNNSEGVFIFGNTNHDLRFGTNGSEKVRIQSGGNVGIGTTSPSEKLEVVGDVLISDILHLRGDNAGEYAGIGFNRNVSNGNIYNSNSPAFQLHLSSDNLELQRYNGSGAFQDYPIFVNGSTGNVGIGTTSPETKLEVQGNALIGTGIANNRSIYGLTVGFTSNSTFGSNGDVSDSNRTLSLVNESTTTNTYSTLSFRNSPSSGTSMADFKYVHRGTSSGDLIYTNNNGGTWTDQFSILSNGNVGIGTISPTNKLEVAGSWKLDGITGGFFSNYTYGTEFNISELNSGGWARANRIRTSDTSGTVFFGVLGGGTTLGRSYWTIGDPSTVDTTGYNTDNGIHLLKNGNVGIGTASPAQKLDVNGNIRVANTIEFLRGGTEYSNYIRSQNYPSQGYTGATDKYWIEYGSKGGHHFVVDTDGGTGAGTNSFDNFTIWKGAVDGPILFQVNNSGGAIFNQQVKWGASSTGDYSGNPRAAVIGYSGGNYGNIGYGWVPTSTSGNYTSAIADLQSRVMLYDGIVVYGSGSAVSVGSTVNFQEVLDARTSRFAYKGNTVWHAGNDGSGSGLDADLLDGWHTSDFASMVNLSTSRITSTSYSSLASATLTGNRTYKVTVRGTYTVSYGGTPFIPYFGLLFSATTNVTVQGVFDRSTTTAGTAGSQAPYYAVGTLSSAPTGSNITAAYHNANTSATYPFVLEATVGVGPSTPTIYFAGRLSASGGGGGYQFNSGTRMIIERIA